MDKSPCCNAELHYYKGGGHIFKGYPYESGYYCTDCGKEFSDLQISRGALEKQDMKKDLETYIKTPRDISKDRLEDQANNLALAFIGMVAMPTGISKEILEKCCEAFNSNRGQFEWESEAILKVLKESK